MSETNTDSEQNRETLEHLLGVVIESREQRCAEVRDRAHDRARDIIGKAYVQARARLHRHVVTLREKYRVRVASATARNQTLLRKQNQKKDQALLDQSWPLLHRAVLARWQDAGSRKDWLDAALDNASSVLLAKNWHIEHAADLDKQDLDHISNRLPSKKGKEPKLIAREDIAAGLRISTHGTVVDATIDGLLKRKHLIEAEIIVRIKRGRGSND